MTTDPPLFLQCGHPVEPVQNGAARRCMVPLNQHDGLEALDHAYVSLMVPCLGCRAAIAWSSPDGWLDSRGADYHPIADGRGIALHKPDPRYL